MLYVYFMIKICCMCWSFDIMFTCSPMSFKVRALKDIIDNTQMEGRKEMLLCDNNIQD